MPQSKGEFRPADCELVEFGVKCGRFRLFRYSTQTAHPWLSGPQLSACDTDAGAESLQARRFKKEEGFEERRGFAGELETDTIEAAMQ